MLFLFPHKKNNHFRLVTLHNKGPTLFMMTGNWFTDQPFTIRLLNIIDHIHTGWFSGFILKMVIIVCVCVCVCERERDRDQVVLPSRFTHTRNLLCCICASLNIENIKIGIEKEIHEAKINTKLRPPRSDSHPLFLYTRALFETKHLDVNCPLL